MEQVLCIPRKNLPGNWVSRRSIVPVTHKDFILTCGHSDAAFIDRATVEQDPSFKQVIPYILLQTHDRELTAVYCRKGSETRLHDLWSVGIGGHINPEDQDRREMDFKRIVQTGMERELDEELIRRPVSDRIDFLGVISEDITPVGSVHLGAVFKITTHTPESYEPGPELFQFQWIRTCDLGDLNLELWSELALELAERH